MIQKASAQDLIWIIVRMLVVASLALPGWGRVTSDVVLFRLWIDGFAAGRSPAGDDMWQYPPGVALLLWFLGVTGLGLVGLFICIAGADGAIMYSVRGTPGGLLWAVAPALVGPLFYMRLDVIVTACAVLGILAGRRTIRSGIALGLGSTMKLWPLMLLAGYSPKDGLKRGFVGLAAYAVVGVAAFLIIGDTEFVANQASRGLQVESLAAYPFMVARALGADIDVVFRFGAMEVATPAADAVAQSLLVCSLVALGGITAWSWRARTSNALAAVGPRALLVLCVLLATSRVLSPQFNVWLLGVTAAVWTTRGAIPARGIAAVCVTSVSAQLLYPHVYGDFWEDGGWLGLGVQGIRLLALLVVLKTAFDLSRSSAQSREEDGASLGLAGVRGE